MNGGLFEFITSALTAMLLVIAMSRLIAARGDENRYYTLVSILAMKGILTVEDLVKLRLFEPRDDVVNALVELAGKLK